MKNLSKFTSIYIAVLGLLISVLIISINEAKGDDQIFPPCNERFCNYGSSCYEVGLGITICSDICNYVEDLELSCTNDYSGITVTCASSACLSVN